MRKATNRDWIEKFTHTPNIEERLWSDLERSGWSVKKLSEEYKVSRGLLYKAIDMAGLSLKFREKAHAKSFFKHPRATYKLDWSEEIEALSELECAKFERLRESNKKKRYSTGISERRALDEIYAQRGYGFKKDPI